MSNYELVTYSQPRSFEAESFRTLRANLQFLGVGDSLKAVMLGGASFGEGTSFMTANLGIIFAQTGQQVIIVDCDLRKPQQNLIFNLDNQHGVTSVLSGYKTPEDVIKQLPVAGVKLITTGMIPANPTEMLGSPKMRQLIADLKEKADVILFDVPPLTVVADGAVLSKSVDGVLMVLRSRASSYEAALKAKELLTNANSRILGVAMNCARMDELSEDYHKHYSKGIKNIMIRNNEKKPGKKEAVEQK